ncbi:RloB family protein [Ihubacter massiliensis]|uniref:RloB family protein n=1 Tax=Hominibacterium faecale TaxID=2839743 RepID=A0A9J6QT18_9FIRM|nr:MULTISPECIES: RloB family protein [Eubacteriales Family XIII. Incertae Sedis]MCO7121671.1 RloB family protein [Ihubacter massiliensis]MCU7378652.1 RloB family protein [Hominibacterium faecale]
MRKENHTFYFSVEGETEKWYLEWLQKIINLDPATAFKVKFDSKIQKNPLARAKQITIIEKIEITHIFDYESSDPVHQKAFQTTLDRMKQSEKLGKAIKYNLGYSNFTFELWMVLHMMDCNGPLTNP